MAKTPLPLKIDEGLMKWIREQASKENRSINNWIETKLFEWKTMHDIITVSPETETMKLWRKSQDK